MEDILAALAAMSSLPSRRKDNAEMDKAGYFVGLEGVSRLSLTTAVRRILRGVLGHGFFPSPPELRLKCDEVARETARELAKIEQRRAQEAEDAALRAARAEKTPEARARVTALYERFRANHTSSTEEAEMKERTEIRNRYGLTDEALASLPDRKDTGTFSKL